MGVLAREALVGFEQGEHNQVKQGPGGSPQQSPAVCAAVSLSTQHPSPHPTEGLSPPSFSRSCISLPLSCPSEPPACYPSTGLTALASDKPAQGEVVLLRAGGERGSPLSSVGSPSQVNTAWHYLQPTWRGTPHQLLQDRGAQRERPVARLLSPWSCSSVAG